MSAREWVVRRLVEPDSFPAVLSQHGGGAGVGQRYVAACAAPSKCKPLTVTKNRNNRWIFRRWGRGHLQMSSKIRVR